MYRGLCLLDTWKDLDNRRHIHFTATSKPPKTYDECKNLIRKAEKSKKNFKEEAIREE